MSNYFADCSVYLIWKYGLRWVGLVDEGCLLLLGILYIQGLVLTQISDLYFLQEIFIACSLPVHYPFPDQD
jgi:hypothetical protein